MVYSTLDIIAISFSLTTIRDRDASFNYFANIKTFSVAFPVFRLTPAKAVDRFSAVFSTSVRFLI
jgi:hypothetical protein